MNGARRVLIVEDEVLIALHLEDLLADLGHRVVAVAARIEGAMSLARAVEVDFAVLDVDLAGSKSFPVAEILRDRGIPVVFATGYGEGIPEELRGGPILRKPYDAEELRRAIEHLPSLR